MASYNNQRYYVRNRTSASSFSRNSYPSASENTDMPEMRHQQERYSGKPNFSESNNRKGFQRSGVNKRDAFPTPQVSGTFARPAMASGSTFSRQQWGNNQMVSTHSRPPTPTIGGGKFFTPTFNGGQMTPMAGVGSIGMPCQPQLNTGNTYLRPQMPGSNMFSRQHLSSGCSNHYSVTPRLQFNVSGVTGTPLSPPRVRFPYGSGADMSPQDPKWISGSNSNTFSRQSRFSSPGTSQQKIPLSPTQQSKAEFKPYKKKFKKRNQFVKRRDDGKKLKPWMTEELYAEVKKKNEMYFTARIYDSAESWQEFRLQRNKINSLIKEAKTKGGFIPRKRKDEDDGKEKPFSCDTCDKAYADESKLDEHFRKHRKCEVNDCQFEAHPKIVELHKKLQHDTGYADAISKLDDAAEIEKWRNERKSRFPTAKNVQKRKAEQEEKVARGEVLETRDFGKFKKRRTEGQQPRHVQSRMGWRSSRGNRGRQRGGRGVRNENRELKTTSPCEVNISDSDDDSHITLHKFRGTLAFTNANVSHEQNSVPMQSVKGSQQNGSVCASISEFERKNRDSQDLNIPSHSSLAKDFKTHFENEAFPSVEDTETLPCERSFNNGEEQMSTTQASHKENECSAELAHLSNNGEEQMSATQASHKENECSAELALLSNNGEEQMSATQASHKENEFSAKLAPLSCDASDQKVNGNESDDDSPDVEPIIKETEATGQVADFIQESSSADKNKILCETPKNLQSKVNQSAQHPKLGQSRKPSGEYYRVKQSTLLEQLLANDIRHERNVIQQCDRYIINNNFFGVKGQRTFKS